MHPQIDPYLNVDAGTMSPFEHGEVFTLDDGGEVDLDLGNYERFIGTTLTRDNNITTGKIYQAPVPRRPRPRRPRARAPPVPMSFSFVGWAGVPRARASRRLPW